MTPVVARALRIGLPLLALAAACAAWWWSPVGTPRRPSAWERYVSAPRTPLPETGRTPRVARIYNELDRLLRERPVWGDAELDRMVEFADGWKSLPVDLRAPTYREPNETEQEVLSVSRVAFSNVADRVGLGGPFAPGARERAEAWIESFMDSPVPYLRLQGMLATINAGGLDNPRIHARVTALQNDPDPNIAEFAKLKLAQHAAFGTRANPRQGTVKHEDFTTP